jgi:hypothetical protein
MRCPGFTSLRYLGVLCASAVRFLPGIHRRDAENAEVAQRMIANQDTTRTSINTNVTEY